MSRAAFRQADIERIIRAARTTGAALRIDIRNLIITVEPGAARPTEDEGAADRRESGDLAPDGKENWDDED